jgi:hypothetical protein
MNEEQKEMLRTIIMQVCQASKPLSAPVGHIMNAAKMGGFQTLEPAELAKQLRYLEAHKMIEREDREISKAVDRYLITQAGTAYLDENFLLPD